MSKIKQLMKKTPLISIYRKHVEKREYDRIMELNYEYKKNIDLLLDKSVLEQKIIDLAESIKSSSRKFYVIAQKNEKVGIYGYINCFLPHIAYAVSKGYIPVIDMQTYNNIYIPQSVEKGKFNSWECFFEQPMGVGLNDLQNEEVIRCPDELWYRWMPNSCPLMNDEEIEMWATLYNHYIRYNSYSNQYIENEEKSILTLPEKTLGVIYRGTTYTKGQAVGHPIQPTMEMLAKKIEDMMKINDIEKIYLASDEKSIVDFMEKRFPGRILINKRVYYDEVEGVDYSKYNEDGTDIVGDMFDRDNNEYLIGIEYISSMNIVSKCNYFVGGACGGTTATLYMNGLKYKERFVYDLGKYGKDPLPKEEGEDEV